MNNTNSVRLYDAVNGKLIQAWEGLSPARAKARFRASKALENTIPKGKAGLIVWYEMDWTVEYQLIIGKASEAC